MVTSSDIIYCGSNEMPIDDVSTSGGDVDTSNVLTDSAVGALFPTMHIDPSNDTTWYYKVCFFNNHATDTWYNVVFYVENLLLDVVSSGTVGLISTSALDTFNVVISGKNTLGVEVSETVTLNGTSYVYSLASFQEVHKVIPAAGYYPVGRVTIVRGITLGIIPIGCGGATNEYSIALEGDIDLTTDVANRLTAPDDEAATPTPLTFSKPNSLLNAVACTGTGGDIPAQSFQGLWVKWTADAGVKSSTDIPLWIVAYGMDEN